jgi:hypothetical protein
MLARVELPTGGRTRLPLVPKDAIVLGGRQQFVLVVDGGGKAGSQGAIRAVPVQLGVADKELIQVEGDVRSGEVVVVLGNERLSAGDRVTITRVMASPPAAETASADPAPSAEAAGR